MSVHVLALIDALGEGGTERSLAEMLPHLEPHGVKVSLATLRSRGDEGVEPELLRQGRQIHRLPARGRVRAFRELVATLRPHVVHSMLYASNMVARTAVSRSGPPLLTSLVNTSYSAERLSTPGTRRLRLRAVQVADAISAHLRVDAFHAVCDAVAIDAQRSLRLSADRITVIHRGRQDPLDQMQPADRAETRADLAISEDALVMLAVGRHEHQKDHATLVRAAAPLLAGAATGTETHLLIAGREGNATATLRTEVEASGAAHRIHLLGHRSDVPNLLAAADLLVLSSRYEGLPGAIIEAMAARLPVVATDLPGVREAVEPDRSALLTPPGDPEALRLAIGRLLADPTERRRLGGRGREIFEQRFTIAIAAERMAALYHSLAARTSPAR